MPRFEDAIRVLQDWGLMDVLVPFMLVFTLVYAILSKIPILGAGTPAKRYNTIVALALALGVIIPHATNYYAPESDPVVIINNSLPSIAGIIIALIMVLILIGAFGKGFKGKKIFRSVFALASFAGVLYIFGANAGWFPYGFAQAWTFYVPPETQSLLVILLVFGLIVYFITGDESTKIDWWGKIKKGLEEFAPEEPGAGGKEE